MNGNVLIPGAVSTTPLKILATISRDNGKIVSNTLSVTVTEGAVNGRDTYSVGAQSGSIGTALGFIRTEVPGAGVDCKVTDPDTSVNPRAFYWVLPE